MEQSIKHHCNSHSLHKIVHCLDQLGNKKRLLAKVDNTNIMTFNGKICNVIWNGSRLEQVNTTTGINDNRSAARRSEETWQEDRVLLRQG